MQSNYFVQSICVIDQTRIHPPPERGGGLLRITLKYAKDLYNCEVGVLTASSDGESVYRKLGFRKIKEFRIANVSVKQSKSRNGKQ